MHVYKITIFYGTIMKRKIICERNYFLSWWKIISVMSKSTPMKGPHRIFCPFCKRNTIRTGKHDCRIMLCCRNNYRLQNIYDAGGAPPSNRRATVDMQQDLYWNGSDPSIHFQLPIMFCFFPKNYGQTFWVYRKL